jgi:uncharacterized protein (DUF983 family)
LIGGWAWSAPRRGKLVAKEKIKAVAYTCDSCGKRFVMEENGDLPAGFHGTVYETGDFGGTAAVSWFACTEMHIATAITTVLEVEAERQRR